MDTQEYIKLLSYNPKSISAKSLTETLHFIIPILILGFYPIQLGYLLFSQGFYAGISNEIFIKFLCIPVGFFTLTILIKMLANASSINFSQNVLYDYSSYFSGIACIISMGFLYVDIKLGIIMFLLTAIHFIINVSKKYHSIKTMLPIMVLGLITGVFFFV